MSADNTFVAGDDASILRVTCKDTAGQAIDLTACSVVLTWKTSRGVFAERAMTIESPASAGKAIYAFEADELVAPLMRFEVDITNAAGKVLTCLDPLYEYVRDPLEKDC